MTEAMKAKRDELKALSAPFKMLVKEGALSTINAGLAAYYAEQGHTTVKSYRQWQKEGFQVQEGSKALLFWGEPKPVHPNEKPKEGEEEETFFPLAYLFSNLQVKPIEAGAQPVQNLQQHNEAA